MSKNKNKQISLVLPSLDGGGAERVFINLANAFHAAGYSVNFLLMHETGSYRQELSPDINVINAGALWPFPFFKTAGKLFTAIFTIAWHMRRQKPAAVLSNRIEANIITLLAKKASFSPVPVLVRETNTMTALIREKNSLKLGLAWRLARVLYRNASAIIVPARAVKVDLAQASPQVMHKVHVIPNPSATPDIPAKAKEDPCHEWLRDKKCPVVLSAGRLVKAKDFETLLNAFSLLQNQARLIVLGEGPERENLLNLASRIGISERVDFAGFDPNPFRYMARADLFALSSRVEGLPNVVIQALACGCPVVATDAPGGTAEILDDGAYGKLVPVGDYRALAAAIDETLAHPPDKDLLTARSALYTPEAVMPQYLKALFP